MIDKKILRFLYSRKHDGKFYDVSSCFDVSDHDNFYNDIEDPHLKSLKNLHSVNLKNVFKISTGKEVIDNSVIALEENGYVVKRVKGYLPPSAISPGDDISDANNSVCKITSKGIDYYETQMQIRRNKIQSFIAIIISLSSLLISIFLD